VLWQDTPRQETLQQELLRQETLRQELLRHEMLQREMLYRPMAPYRRVMRLGGTTLHRGMRLSHGKCD
jgi:hypothetical protein